MNYKGYTGHIVDFDEETGMLHGRVLGLRDVVTFEAETIPAAIEEFKKSLDVYLAFCEKQGKSPEKPYSGEFRLRLSPELHRELAIKAELERKSMNEFVVERLEAAVH